DDPIACLNKAMAFLTAVASSSTTYKSNATNLMGNITSGQARVVKCYTCQGEGHMARQCTQPKRPRNAAWYKEKAMLAEPQEAGQILDEEKLVFLIDLGIPATVLMTNISNYGSDVISEVPNSETYLNDMDNQSVHALQDFEHSPVMDFTDNEISSDSNIIPYSQYLQETQQATVQDINLQAQQDSMILAVIEQMSEQMINHVNNWEKANKEQNNDSITAELERYKERVKTFEQRLNIDLISREKMIDSQMDDMIREKLALKEKIDTLEQNLSKQIKENESLFQTFIVLKNESKEKENKYMETEIDLEKKIKELDNIICKVVQSTQTKAQRIKPTLYDGVVMSNTHVAMPVIYDDETMILEEESRSKMFEIAKDPKVIQQKISHKPIDYEKLNRLINDFGKRFSPQQELSAEQAFWLRISNPSIERSYTPPVIVDVPSELPMELLVYVQDMCPNAITPSTKKVVVTPMNNVKKVRLSEPLISSSNIKQVESSNTSDYNTPVLSSTRVKRSTSICRSKPLGNKKNDRISQKQSRNKKNKVEAKPRKVNKSNRVVLVCDVDVKHSLSNANSKIICGSCNKSMFDAVHDKCLLDFVQN
ncbi:integrase, catalytic region, zinc finger, CCHC-type containing protein, partial [Tanacetum coccineum]